MTKRNPYLFSGPIKNDPVSRFYGNANRRGVIGIDFGSGDRSVEWVHFGPGMSSAHLRSPENLLVRAIIATAIVLGSLAFVTSVLADEMGPITNNTGILSQGGVTTAEPPFPTFSTSGLMFQPSSFMFSNGKTLVSISADGKVIYGEGYTPDDAARAFWDAVGRARQCK